MRLIIDIRQSRCDEFVGAGRRREFRVGEMSKFLGMHQIVKLAADYGLRFGFFGCLREAKDYLFG